MDEAHKTVGRKDKMFAHLLNEKNIKIKKRLFMTATERQFIGSSDEIASMDDPDVYGETFELLTFKEAIEAKEPIICDYRFVTISISEREMARTPGTAQRGWRFGSPWPIPSLDEAFRQISIADNSAAAGLASETRPTWLSSRSTRSYIVSTEASRKPRTRKRPASRPSREDIS